MNRFDAHRKIPMKSISIKVSAETFKFFKQQDINISSLVRSLLEEIKLTEKM